MGAQTTDTFSYTADDGHGGTGTATVSITVTGVNDAPVANPDTYSTPADVTLNDGSSVLTNDTDADGDGSQRFSSPVRRTRPRSRSIRRDVQLHADGGFTGADTFTYKANDGTADSNTVTVTINVTP